MEGGLLGLSARFSSSPSSPSRMFRIRSDLRVRDLSIIMPVGIK